jgi:hypothetical protein
MNKKLSRRNFLQVSALTVGALGTGAKAIGQVKSSTVALIANPDDPLISSPPVVWALQELEAALTQKGITVQRALDIKNTATTDLYVIAAGNTLPLAEKLLSQPVSKKPEANAVLVHKHKGKPALLATGSDARGLMYAMLELADQVEHAPNPVEALIARKSITEEPFNEVRGISRLFVSDVQDKPWFNDRAMWPAYFSMLAKQRFNRFQLSFGIGFDFLEYVTDSYLLFAYPFLLSVPGYNVRAVNLPDEERDRNLETLRYISAQCVAHGIDFQLGIWTHGYQWEKTPMSNYTIEGITPENHAAYSHDAIATLLKACPNISGVTLRTHGESGVREGSFDFWKTIFQGVAQSGRKVEIDLHTKGLNQTILDSALATGMPVKLSPKYWAEHMGLPYHQTAIRDQEMPNEDKKNEGFFSLSSGSRSFTRYGYADFLREDRQYSVMYRIWPGSHRFLLWGDPVSNAAHARAFRFCGSNGVELQEPLSFKGRRGSGIAGDRCGYADASLTPKYDWEKYLYTYRTWGRLLYNPDADPDTWRRQLRQQFQEGAPAVEASLGAATRIVPLVTSAHLPSAANDTFNPEFYTNQYIVDVGKYPPYGDTPSPKVFGNVSPLDPQIFSRVNDFATELLSGQRSGKYSPIEVAQWLEDLADKASTQLAVAEGKTDKNAVEFRRMAADVRIQIALGRFFATKLRAGVLYAIHEQSPNLNGNDALREALEAYRKARDIWAQLAEETSRIYVPDLTFGPRPYQRGNWGDRLPAMDDDIAEMAKRVEAIPHHGISIEITQIAVDQALSHPQRRAIVCNHAPSAKFIRGKDLEIAMSTSQQGSAHLYYRHVNQSERYQNVKMQSKTGKYLATIPGSYTDSEYPLQYYFELKEEKRYANAWLYPGLNADLANQPYFVVRSV